MSPRETAQLAAQQAHVASLLNAMAVINRAQREFMAAIENAAIEYGRRLEAIDRDHPKETTDHD